MYSAIGFTLAGCGNTAGVEEFKLYATSVDTLVVATEPITQRLRVAERARARRMIDEGGVVESKTAGAPNHGLAPDFVVEHAAYLADTGYPPFAGAVHFSMVSLKRFNDAALVYAEGRALDAARGDVESLIKNTSSGLSLLGVPTAPAPVVDVILEGVSAIGAVGSREAFKTLLMEEGARLDKLLSELELKSPTVFKNLAEEKLIQREDAISDVDTARVDALANEIRTDRMLTAEWVLMIRLSRTLLQDVLVAIEAPSSASGRLAEAAELSADFQTRLDRIRTLIATNS